MNHPIASNLCIVYIVLCFISWFLINSWTLSNQIDSPQRPKKPPTHMSHWHRLCGWDYKILDWGKHLIVSSLLITFGLCTAIFTRWVECHYFLSLVHLIFDLSSTFLVFLWLFVLLLYSILNKVNKTCDWSFYLSKQTHPDQQPPKGWLKAFFSCSIANIGCCTSIFKQISPISQLLGSLLIYSDGVIAMRHSGFPDVEAYKTLVLLF